MCPVPMDQRARLRKSAEIFIREGICQRKVPKVLHDKVCPFSQLFVAAGQRCCKDRLTAFWSQTKKHHLFGNRSKRQGRGKGVSDLVISIRPEDKCLVRRQHDARVGAIKQFLQIGSVSTPFRLPVERIGDKAHLHGLED